MCEALHCCYCSSGHARPQLSSGMWRFLLYVYDWSWKYLMEFNLGPVCRVLPAHLIVITTVKFSQPCSSPRTAPSRTTAPGCAVILLQKYFLTKLSQTVTMYRHAPLRKHGKCLRTDDGEGTEERARRKAAETGISVTT